MPYFIIRRIKLSQQAYLAVQRSQLLLTAFKPIPSHFMMVEFFVNSWTSNFAWKFKQNNDLYIGFNIDYSL